MRCLIPVLMVMLVLAGCGPKAPANGRIQGTVTYKGNAVNDATLTFNPAGDNKASLLFATSDKEGKFVAVDVPPGEYKITVQGATGTSGVPDTRRKDSSKMTPEMKARMEALKTTPTIPFPAKYKQSHTSGLDIKVVPGQQTFDIVMKD